MGGVPARRRAAETSGDRSNACKRGRVRRYVPYLRPRFESGSSRNPRPWDFIKVAVVRLPGNVAPWQLALLLPGRSPDPGQSVRAGGAKRLDRSPGRLRRELQPLQRDAPHRLDAAQ